MENDTIKCKERELASKKNNYAEKQEGIKIMNYSNLNIVVIKIPLLVLF